MRLTLSVSLAALILAACGQAGTNAGSDTSKPAAGSGEIKTVANESERLNEWFEAKYKEQLDFSPITKMFQGIDEDQDKIDDFSITAQDEQLEWQRASVAEMKAQFDYDKLSKEAKTSYDLWIYQLEQAEASLPYRTNAYIFDQMSAIHSFFPQILIAFHKVTDKEDMENYISRVVASEVAMDQLIDLSKMSAETGVRPPRFSFELVIEEARKIITGAPFTDGEDSAVWADAKAKISNLLETEKITQEEADALQTKTRDAFLTNWQPAFERLIAWQEADIANTPDIGQGVGALPNGEAYYNERLANQTTTNLTSDEIHAIGLAEVARLKAEMEAIKDEVDFDGTLQDFFAFMRDTKDDERLYYPNTDEGRQAYIDDATAAINKVTEKLPDYFGIMPKAELVVKRVEAFREQDGAAQHYFPGTPDGSRPGIYYAHLSDMTAMPKRELEVIAYHEGNPGHHMQISIAQELEGVPTFRTQGGYTAYVEGWALYSEFLASEIEGTFEDPYSRFGRLGSEIWRAVRLVLDTGLHAKGWTEEEAVAYFLENSAITESQARSEVRRYMVLPGQATSYKIGMLKIQELRQKAKDELGDKFDIRGFHDTVLGGGAMPLAILERRVNAWIAEEKAG